MNRPHFFSCLLAALAAATVVAAEPRQVSGIYPHLAMFNEEGECGTGAVVPWAERLWVVTYAPHKPQGSTDKLYEITPALEQIVRPESIGGTPANRMIHAESHQLFIGPYVIGTDGRVRVIPYDVMFGRPTGMARHLAQPANKIVYATMEEGFYEVDVKTLAVTELWADEQRTTGRKANLPGYHGKGFYSAQGRYVYANNGDHAPAALRDPAVPSGVLAEWDGKAPEWTIVRRNQFTEVTGPGGIDGNPPGDDRVWSIGWDHRSLILMTRANGVWSSFRLPKASHCYDGAHGWNTEWPRIRDIGEKHLLMTMHGSFWTFPRDFSPARSSGISSRSTYLKVIGDFCRWNDRLVFGCDDTARNEFLNKSRLKGNLAGPGRSQSNLWFVDPPRLDRFGPPLGRGAVWLSEDVKAGVPSEPFLFSGFARRSLHLAHGGEQPISFIIETDAKGNGRWTRLREVTVPAKGGVWVEFKRGESGAWVRLTAARDAAQTTAFFHYAGEDQRSAQPAPIFRGISPLRETEVTGGILHARGADFKTLRFLARNPAGQIGGYDLDGNLRLRAVQDREGAEWLDRNAAIPPPVIGADAASVVYIDEAGRRWRLPRGDVAFDHPGALGAARACREISTERNLLNVYGSFYELPADNAGGFAKVRPIATHNRRIVDYASYRGLLVISGLSADAGGQHIIRSDDGRCALWVGAVDDLWQFGKPWGVGGPWMNTAVKANEPSDPYLMTGYDRKRVTLSHQGGRPVRLRLELDISGTGVWVAYRDFLVGAGNRVQHRFPDSLGAYWARITADQDTTATAQFAYD